MKNFLLKISRSFAAKKKIFSLFFASVFAMCLSAQVGYLIPYTADVNFNSIGNVYDYLPLESSGSVEESPERKAYEWFNNDYNNAAGKNKKFFTVKDIKEGALLSEGVPTVTALWVNVDRVGYSLVDFDVMFNDDFKTALENYVKAGGNLYLSKQATRLVTKINRCSWWPREYKNGGYEDGSDVWKMTDNFCAGYNRHGHAMIKYIEDYADGWHFPLTSGEGTYKRTNNNNLWDDWSAYGISENGCDAYPDGDLKDKNIRVHKFETAQNCQILGGWGHTQGMDCAGFIEFFPNGDFKGTVVVMGLSAYQWGASNKSVYNVKNLTKGVLDYLSITETGLAWNEETIPASGSINTQHAMTAHANAGFTIRYGADDPLIANIGDMNGNIYFNYFGNATFTATATGDGWTAPKSATATIHSATIPVNGGDQNVKYAYVLPYSLHTMSTYGNEKGLRPDFEAANWFYDQYIANGVGGEHGCFVRPSDLGSLNPAIKVLWIHNDHVGQASNDYYNNDLGGDTFRANLANFLANGGNVFVSKQATRLIGDLGRNNYPRYANGDNYEERGPWRIGNKWNFPEGGEVDRSTHRVYTGMGTGTEIMARNRHTDNNCVWHQEDAVFDTRYASNNAQRLTQYESDHNCVILGAWGHDDDKGVNNVLECVGFVEYKPQNNVTLNASSTTFNQQGTIIAMGLAAFHWANPTNELKTLTRNTLSYLNFMNARPCALDNTTPMETRLERNDYYPDNTTTFLKLHPVCENLNATYTLTDNPGGIARIQEGVQVGENTITQLQFKAAGKVTFHITLTETRNDVNWPTGTYEYDREITFAYADDQAAQDGPNFTWPSQFETGAVGPNSVITLPATVAELPVSYEVIGDASLEGNEMTLANVESGSVTVNASVTETGYHEAWPAGVYNYQNSLTFHAAEVGYLLPAAESIDHLKFSDDPDYQDQQPEYNAAKWFEDNYITCANPKGRFVTVDELPTLFAKGIKTLWVNIERVNIDNTNGLLSACLTDDGLKTYIQAGGNVLLTKQATRLAYTMGRIDYEPAFNAGGYFEPTNPGESRSISTRMGTDNEVDEVLDMSGHRLFADMLSWHDAKHVFLVGENCWQTNNYCSWQDFMRKEGEETHYDNKKIQRVQDFEADWNATVFGIQGDIPDYCYSNVVEFNAIENEWAGRILTIGATGYQWGSANPTAELDNVKKLTANSLSYLLDEPLADEVYTRNGLTPGIYGTICFDYAVEAGHIEGAEIYELTSFNATNDGVILTQMPW